MLGKEVSKFNALFRHLSPQRPWFDNLDTSAKNGSLGYLISLIDATPDFTPVFGYSDKFALIAAAVASLASVNTKVKVDFP